MRYLFRRRIPSISRILLVESGSRHLLDKVIGILRMLYGEDVAIDLITCYSGLPSSLETRPARAPEPTVYRVSDYGGGSGRKRLYAELRSRGYSLEGVICSGEPILFKWKLALAVQVPAKVFIINENGDFFWLDYGQWRIISRVVSARLGLSGAEAVRTLVRLALFPFTLSYLLLYAAAVHLRRKAHR
jgi:hypothetical protein